MARHVRIPMIADVVLTDDPKEIRVLAADTRLDRTFAQRGPLLNRLIVRRIRGALAFRGSPLPPVAPRDAPGRAAAQAALESRLGSLTEPCSPEQLSELADHMTGRRDPAALPALVQAVVGSLFVAEYRPAAGRWRAARLLDAGVRSNNLVRRLWWIVTGDISRAREQLAKAVGNDPSGLHATGVAVHNLVASFEAMRDLLAQPWSACSMTTESAVARCLSAPSAVLRQADAHMITAAAELRRNTIVVCDLNAAHAREPSGDTAFMIESWSRCPAASWVTALLSAVWTQAVGVLPAMDGAP